MGKKKAVRASLGKEKQPVEWREVIKPVLGVLLVAREPLGARHIRQILGVEDDWLREGIERLGGLIVKDWQQRYSLFHLKLYEYLRQDEQRPSKEYIFDCQPSLSGFIIQEERSYQKYVKKIQTNQTKEKVNSQSVASR